MHEGFTFHDNVKESHLFISRVIWCWFFSILAIAVLIWRLIDLQIIHHKIYFSQSEDNRIRIAPLPPTRGHIYDRNGVLLAHNLPAFTLEVVPERVRNLPLLIDRIRQYIDISDTEKERFISLAARNRVVSIPLRYQLTEEEVARFAVNRYKFPGVEIEARINRHYPLAKLTSHVLGYVARIDEKDMENLKDDPNYRGSLHIGKKGVEKYYEKILHGTVGYQQVETDARGRKLRVLGRTPPKAGQDIYLTIDIRLQAAASNALQGRRGSVVAVNPNNGEILALVSEPGFDPNPFVNGIDQKSYDALQDPWWRPLFNRALQGRYPPGSTIKPFVGLAGLELGVIDSEKQIYCRGWYSLPHSTHRYRDWKKTGHGKVNLNTAIVRSCDVYFYDLALHIGIDRLSNYLAQFGFGRSTHVDLTDEKEGILPSPAWKRHSRGESWYQGETVISGIGQGYWLITPLQLAVATATLASKGVRIQPRVLYAVKDTDTNEFTTQQSFQHTPIPISDSTNWDKVLKGMHDVVHSPRGTAFYRAGRGAPFQFGGKTGTAQVISIKQEDDHTNTDDLPEKFRDHALFIAFAPVDNPTIAIAVVVENGGHGSSSAAPVARALLDQYFETRKL